MFESPSFHFSLTENGPFKETFILSTNDLLPHWGWSNESVKVCNFFSFGITSQNNCVKVIPVKICFNNETQRTPSKSNEKCLRNMQRMHPAVCKDSAKLCSMKNTIASRHIQAKNVSAFAAVWSLNMAFVFFRFGKSSIHIVVILVSQIPNLLPNSITKK